MPDFVREALRRRGLLEAYRAPPPYQQNDYIGWIIRAKRGETQEKRIQQMLEELTRGDRYMGMPYRVRSAKKSSPGSSLTAIDHRGPSRERFTDPRRKRP